jgi:cation:H+ antiporter
MMIVAVLSLIAGGALLMIGAEALVRGAARLAGMLGISPLIIGLTVVSYGTSAPELAVSIQSSLAGQGDIALGNVIGSNIFNVLMILGLSSLVAPLTVAQQLIRLDVPIMVGISALLLLFAADGILQPSDGLVLFIGSIVYTAFLIYQSRRETDIEVQDEYAREYAGSKSTLKTSLINLMMVIVGVAVLVLGSRLLVSGAVTVARAIGVSELVIGLTIIAAGTSLPELATSAVATFRGERDIAVGNVIGSNIFNILTVLGVAALVTGVGIPIPTSVMRFDLPVMMAVAVACFPIFVTGNVISRWEGLLFTGYYIAYSAFLILRAADHDRLVMFSRVMLMFVIPLTIITLGTIMWRTFRRSPPPPLEAPEDHPISKHSRR